MAITTIAGQIIPLISSWLKNMHYQGFVRLLAFSMFYLTTGTVIADETSDFVLGKKLFSSVVPPCGICHTLKDAGSEGAVGQILDELKPNQLRVITALTNGIGAMPSFKEKLSPDEIRAIALYVSKASVAQ